jgi:ribonuclease P protein component
VRTEHFILLLYARSADDNPALARLGIVVSKKVGNAAHRNRCKRLIREAFRATRDLWNAGVDLVVIVHAPLKAMKLGDVVDEWRGATGHIRRQTTRAFERRSESRGSERARRAAGSHPRAD